MNHELKKILLKLAQLPRADQHWVLKHLSVQQRMQFSRVQGPKLLDDARTFRKVPCPPLSIAEPQLPELCQTLQQAEPLYSAIILEQGQFSWEQQFIKQCPQQQQIETLLQTQVGLLKTATKELIFQQWQTQLSFQEQLETGHG